jgi:hypothetical protein
MTGSHESGLFVDQLADGPGVSRIDPADPASPLYRLLARMRSPVTLRELMHRFYFFPGLFKQGDEAFAAIGKFVARVL